VGFGLPATAIVRNFLAHFSIVPFIVDLVGFIHPVSLKFLQSIADRAKGIYNVGFKGMFIYFQRRISCALAKTMSNNLLVELLQLIVKCLMQN
jgi:hypothetical protein